MSEDTTSGLPPFSQWTIEDLKNLDEEQFRMDVLIPLFGQMGFREVEHMHGRTEFGKDIVFWRDSRFGWRENTAVVAKAGNINANVRLDVDSVGRQIQQAFNIDYPERSKADEQQQTNRVIVAATGTIKSQSRKAILGTVNSDVLNRNTFFMDGNHVLELLKRYFGGIHTNAFPTLRDPVGPAGLAVSPDTQIIEDIVQQTVGRTISVLERRIQDNYRLKENFHGNSDYLYTLGKQLVQQQQTSISGYVIAGTNGGDVTYGPQHLLISRSPFDGQPEIQTAELDPIQIIGRVLTDDSDSNGVLTRLELRFSLQGYDAIRVRDAMKLWISITEGNPLKLVEVNSKRVLFEARWGGDSASAEATPPEELVRYLDDLCFIQEQIGTILTLPHRNLTNRDLLDATELRQILESGLYAEPFEPFSISLPPRDDLNLPEKFAPGEKSYLTLGPFDQGSYDILNRTVQLGPGYETYKVVMTEEDHKSLEQQLTDGISPVEMTFHQAAGSDGVKRYYRNYLPAKHQENFDRHFGPLLEEGETSADDS